MIIGYFADGPWSHLALDQLLADTEIKVAFICARWDRQDEHLKQVAEHIGIDFLAHKNINDQGFYQQVSGYACDLFVSMSFNQIFRRNLIDLPPMGTINCHAGKLPFYRGRNILNWALINDEKEFGITVHYVDEGIDTGDIIMQEVFPISDNDNYKTLLEQAYTGCADLLYRGIKSIQNGSIKPIIQKEIHPLGSYCSARKDGDEVLNWNQNSRDIFNFVRAICPPGPSARTSIGDRQIKINKVEFLKDAPKYKGIPGCVLATGNEGVLVKTLDSYVQVVDYEADIKLRTGNRLQ